MSLQQQNEQPPLYCAHLTSGVTAGPLVRSTRRRRRAPIVTEALLGSPGEAGFPCDILIYLERKCLNNLCHCSWGHGGGRDGVRV